MTTARPRDFTLPPGLLAELEAVADAEHRSLDDVLREMVEQGISDRWQAHADREFQRARELGLPDDDGEMTSEYRESFREKISAGLRSVREGRVTDGPTFMARMDAELAQRETKHEER